MAPMVDVDDHALADIAEEAGIGDEEQRLRCARTRAWRRPSRVVDADEGEEERGRRASRR